MSRLIGTLGGLGRAVHIRETPEARTSSTAPALPRRHVQVELAVSRDHRVLDVTTAVRRAVAAALADEPSVAVVVTAIDS
ncbi:hypothetical protein HUT18_04700 [Streptomyces sp. NA04227]|nr:hypothetical protein HUT18_04700 [Streptomyces sp. NA04227]